MTSKTKTNKTTPATDNSNAVVIVSYLWGNTSKRRYKGFTDIDAARKFYAAKDKAGKQPMAKAPDLQTLAADMTAYLKGKADAPIAPMTNAKPAKASGKPAKKATGKPDKAPSKARAASKAPKAVVTARTPSRSTRTALAGQVLAKYGLEVGITDAMVAELDQLFGKASPVESKFVLRQGRNVLMGYLESTGRTK